MKKHFQPTQQLNIYIIAQALLESSQKTFSFVVAAADGPET